MRPGSGREHSCTGGHKAPGGKLIAADPEVVDGRIAQVRVSGGASFPSRRHAGTHRRRGGRDGQPPPAPCPMAPWSAPAPRWPAGRPPRTSRRSPRGAGPGPARTDPGGFRRRERSLGVRRPL